MVRLKRFGISFAVGFLLWLMLTICLRVELNGYSLQYDLQYNVQSNTQIFYSNDSQSYLEEDSILFNVVNGKINEIKAAVNGKSRYLRIDLGDFDNQVSLSGLNIGAKFKSIGLAEDLIKSQNGVDDLSYDGTLYSIIVSGDDPYIIFDLEKPLHELQVNVDHINNILKLIAVLISILAFIGTYKKYNELKEDAKWLLNILREWKRIERLALNDFKMKYAASYLGTFWAFVQPVVTVTIYSIIFGLGFKSLPVQGISFPLWLTVGIIPWFFFSESLLAATNSLMEYSYLVKKVVFGVNVLPIVKIVSSSFIHAFFILVAVVMQVASHKMISIYIIQTLYYSFCAAVLVTGLSYITSATVVFFKDLGQIVGILLQFGMWATPIMYSSDILGPTVEKVLKLNPMYYIVDGYRDAFFQNVWFWEKPQLGIYFWIITTAALLIGVKVFKGLEKHFADVL